MRLIHKEPKNVDVQINFIIL